MRPPGPRRGSASGVAFLAAMLYKVRSALGPAWPVGPGVL
jgi:hypothetical protein